MHFPWGQTFWVYNLFFHFQSFLSMATTSKMREAGGEGCQEHQRTEQMQSAGRTEWITRRQNAAGAYLLSPSGSVTENDHSWVQVRGNSAPPSSCTDVPVCGSTFPSRWLEVLERETVWKSMQKKKKLFQGRKQQNYDDKGNNSHMNRIRRD